MKGLFVTGTDTDVGKTWIGSKLVAELNKLAIDVQVRKPIESGWPIKDVTTTDAWKLAEALGQISQLDIICPNRFSAALSPDRAAMLEGEKIMLEQLHQDCINQIKKDDFLYVEGAGGFYSPISNDGLNADLAVLLQLPVLLVVEDRLGCINQTLLNIEAIRSRGLTLSAIALNQSNHVEVDGMDNFSDIKKRVNCEVVAFSHNQSSNEPMQRLMKILIDQSELP